MFYEKVAVLIETTKFSVFLSFYLLARADAQKRILFSDIIGPYCRCSSTCSIFVLQTALIISIGND